MRRATISVALAVAAGAALTGCGNNSLAGNNTGPTASVTTSSAVDKAAAALVPASIKKAGVLVVGSDASYAPSEFLASDGHTIEGFDVDLFKAVAKKLGLTAQFQNASFGTIIGGVTSGKYNVGVSSFTINSSRLQQVNMVSYFNAGTQWATTPGNPKKVNPAKPCGVNVAVQANTVQAQSDMPAKVQACQKAGKPVKVDPYNQQSQATASVVSGKDDAMLADSPVIAYAVKQSNGKLVSLGKIYSSAPYGYVIAKNQTNLAKAILMAVKDVQSDGDYVKILKNWGVDQGAITNFALNPNVP